MRTMTRRGVLGGIGALFAAAGVPIRHKSRTRSVTATTPPRVWLGADYWANRLQDWQFANNRFECLSAGPEDFVRTVAVLTSELVPGDFGATLSVRTGTLAGGAGFSGFLVGIGGGTLDYRAAALVQGVSGTKGGLLCIYDSDGRVRFRDHASESAQTKFAPLAVAKRRDPGRARSTGEDVTLSLTLVPAGRGSLTATLTARTTGTGKLLSTAALTVSSAMLVGGIALVSSPMPPATGARYWLADVKITGRKIRRRPGRALGPLVGAMWSLDTSGLSPVLKLTAQCVPISADDPQQIQLQWRPAGSGADWTGQATASLGSGFAAQFRLDTWDASMDHEYQLIYGAGTSTPTSIGGTIRKDPSDSPQLVVAVMNCTLPAFRVMQKPTPLRQAYPGARPIGMYTPANLYFPYQDIAAHIAAQRPDLVAVLGDQYYEYTPSGVDTSDDPVLGYLYRYLMWLWAFRDLVSSTACVVLLDDHDVDQPNLWGNDGRPAPRGDFRAGGYTKSPDWQNLLIATQCGHDWDPYDPTPVEQGIGVYYGMARFGDVSFALLEDRKFKTGNASGIDPATGQPFDPDTLELLGARQEAFLADWATRDRDLPKVVLTQTLWFTLQTDPSGRPRTDTDSNGWPRAARRRALSIVKQAGGVILSGDQHLGSIIRQGLTTYTDGPIQFTTPASATSFQRWWEPNAPLPNAQATPYTGDATDAYGNQCHVLAVANPAITFAEYRKGYRSGADLGDRALKKEGYGILRIDKGQREYVFECWPHDVDPSSGSQFAGWPVTVPFDAA